MNSANELVSVLIKRASVEIELSETLLSRGVPPTPDNIDDMSELVSDLTVLGINIVAGRVDKALVDWCGLLLDA